MKVEKKDNRYAIVKDDGTSVILTCLEAGLLINFIGKEGLRSQIEDRIAIAELDWLDIEKYSGTREEFAQEIFEEFEDEIDYGNSVGDDDIDDSIADLARFYGLEKEV